MKKDIHEKLKIKFWILTLSFLLLILLPCIVKANVQSSDAKRNMFYVEILNYTMPVVRSISFNEEDMAENKFSVKEMGAQLLGLDIEKPFSVVEREIPFLATKDRDVNAKKLNNFNLEDKEVSKETVKEENTKNNQEIALKDKTVTVYDPKLKKTLNNSRPEVLIYHTHTSEGYKPGPPDNGNNSQNVVAVGDELVKELQENFGISAINDRTVHDREMYTQSYSRSAVTVDKYLKKYGDFKIIIDLHRDSVEDKKAVLTKMNGENAAKIMFVMARKNPHFDKNMNIANKMIQTSDKLFPGFCKGILYYNYGTRFFNQDKSNNSVLIEVGADINDIQETKASSKYIARLIAECINSRN